MVRTEGLDKQNKSQTEISVTQYDWLRRGMAQPAGKLPLFDLDGAKIPARLILSCLKAGWAEPWFSNPIKADWLVCKLTDLGQQQVHHYEQKCDSSRPETRKQVLKQNIEAVD